MSLMEPLANRLGGQTTPAKSLVMPRYSEYKASGVEWLGEVPGHWEVKPIKHLGRLKGGAGFPHAEQGMEGEELSFHKVNALGQATSDGVLLPSDNTISRETANRLGAFVFPENSIVFAKVGAALLLGRIRLISEPACLDNNMMGLVVNHGSHDTGFVRNAMSLVRFDLIANPGAVPSLNEGQIGNFPLASPPLEEQQTIAAFLDSETGKIDALIAEQRRLVELLAEKRQAVISHAVTKGLNPARHSRAGGNPAEKIDPRSGQNSCPAPQEFSNQLDSRLRGNDGVAMKDSGIEWLGEVPEHWEVKRLKHSLHLLTEKTDRRNNPIALENIEGWSGRFIPTGTEFQCEGIAFESGDILFGKLRPYLAKVYLTKSSGEAVGDFHVLRPAPKMNGRFWVYQMLNRDFITIIDSSTFGAKMPRVAWEFMSNMRLTVPPLEEQRAIVTFLDTETAKFDTLTAEAQRAIDLLQERRSALISAAVTGKIDVRGIQALPQ